METFITKAKTTASKPEAVAIINSIIFLPNHKYFLIPKIRTNNMQTVNTGSQFTWYNKIIINKIQLYN